MVTSQSLKFEDFARTQIFKYLKNQTLLSLQIKKNSFIVLQSQSITKYSFVMEVTFDLIFLIKLFLQMTSNSRQKLKNPENKKR